MSSWIQLFAYYISSYLYTILCFTGICYTQKNEVKRVKKFNLFRNIVPSSIHVFGASSQLTIWQVTLREMPAP
jgi:Na+/H+-dicarboxylate symporter